MSPSYDSAATPLAVQIRANVLSRMTDVERLTDSRNRDESRGNVYQRGIMEETERVFDETTRFGMKCPLLRRPKHRMAPDGDIVPRFIVALVAVSEDPGTSIGDTIARHSAVGELLYLYITR